VRFWYRESARPLAGAGGGVVTASDPPLEPGMARVSLDTRGRLLELSAPPVEGVSPAGAAPDWALALREAALDPAALERTEPAFLPRAYADERVAWRGVFPEQTNVPLRVEGAAYRGRIVDFRVLGPWDAPGAPAPRPAGIDALTSGLTVVIIPVVAVGLALARRNHRLGRGDRRGAFRIASVALVVGLASWLFRTEHTASPVVEWGSLQEGAGRALYQAALLWLLYMALEPYVRRLWPRTLLSWSRLLSGRFRDPLVGRDLLAGALSANLIFVSVVLGRSAIEAIGRPAPRLLELNLGLLLGPRKLAATAAWGLWAAVFLALLMLMFLVVLRAILRRRWAAVLVFAVVWMAIPLAGFGGAQFLEGLIWAVYAAVCTALVAHFGLLATATALFLGIQGIPVTLDLGAWYGGPAVYAFALELGIAAYGLYACLAGRSLSWGRMFED
jgi:serine/threonine-protein kinase